MAKVALIGYGSMGRMLLECFLSSGALAPSDVVVSTRTRSKLDEARARWPELYVARGNAEAVSAARHVFLCVKPGDVRQVLAEVLPVLTSATHIVSIAGTVPMAVIEGMTGGAVTKVIPNVAVEVGGGVTLYCHNAAVPPEDAAFVEGLLRSIGEARPLPECNFAMGTMLASCMPGFLAAICQELVEAALRRSDDIGREEAGELVRLTLLGTARLMVEKGRGFDELIARVATKGGITAEGVEALRAGLPPVFDEMYDRALKKRAEIADRVTQGDDFL